MNLNDMSREDLIALLEVHAKSWLAHDGCWFLAAERRDGMETANRRVEMTCVHAPPDPVTDSFCEWEFRLEPCAVACQTTTGARCVSEACQGGES